MNEIIFQQVSKKSTYDMSFFNVLCLISEAVEDHSVYSRSSTVKSEAIWWAIFKRCYLNSHLKLKVWLPTTFTQMEQKWTEGLTTIFLFVWPIWTVCLPITNPRSRYAPLVWRNLFWTSEKTFGTFAHSSNKPCSKWKETTQLIKFMSKGEWILKLWNVWAKVSKRKWASISFKHSSK